MVTVERYAVKQVVKNLLMGNDYRDEFLLVIESEFLNYCLEYFKKIMKKHNYEKQDIMQFVSKKDNSKNDIKNKYDWYKDLMLNPNLDKDEVAYNAGLNIKTINNLYNTTRKDVVITASQEHFNNFLNTLEEFLEDNQEIDAILTIKIGKTSVDFNIVELLFFINSLAVKRSAIRGGS
ncbi:MAG: hypothetical protein ACTSQG_11215, partial [Promethearchaeota archaeon]